MAQDDVSLTFAMDVPVVVVDYAHATMFTSTMESVIESHVREHTLVSLVENIETTVVDTHESSPSS